MVASENGTPYSPPSVPSVPVHNPTAAPKEKKIKGLFKAPSIDVSLRKARAEVQAPTPSTAYEDPSAVPRAETETAQTVMGALTEKQARMLAAKRVRELEREAKERETLNSQHPTMINGEWHCANCGVPKDLATGIRKGPSGERTLCGNCGKYYHRNKRNRPVPYSTERSFHEKVKYDPTTNLKPKSRKKRLISSRGQTTVPATPSDFEMQRTPSRHTHDTQSPPPSKPNNARAASPASSSSASDAPLSHATKMPNGVASHGNAVAPPSKSAPSTEPPAEPPRLASILSPAVTRTAPVSPHGVSFLCAPVHSMPPEWLVLQVHKMQDRYPDDRFEAILRKGQAPTPEWRIKCLDCPGKLYTPGPGETLTNYEVHLKNRQHRQRVNERLQKQAAA
ncbi:hypothetical protein FISHEDRAFT_40581 [Fistulina hepatica ATCC 64428]|uniref:GATA-type domain-containing protein n=1 Tax=Fistulina hepatica ATCC 64428 TaxID=1128425 RepID=A0A0D7AHK2_9AGAR|nr:hypothetical protein FISHEDRAFT_40581 [Fistulina hepatica ATCC 64428]